MIILANSFEKILNISISIFDSISAEMASFQVLDPTIVLAPHITPLSNLSLSKLQRGQFEEVEDGSGNSIYKPPPLELYTKVSLQLYFCAFWVIIFIQMLTIFMIDILWIRNIPESVTLWERLMHANLKSNFPLPYLNWHEGNGNCNDHVKRQKDANYEVLVATAVNLFFNLIMLTPLVILCKSMIFVTGNTANHFLVFIHNRLAGL